MEQQRSRAPKPAGATPRIALTIAGSDSGGGAGIQADLKTFHRFGVYGTSALTLITAQNTLGVRELHLLRPELVAKQIEVVAGDFELCAAKTGALGSEELIEAVVAGVAEHAIPNLVVDPVMISKHGDPLLPKAAVDVLRRRLFPHAALVTPNLHEAALLLERTPGIQLPNELLLYARTLSYLFGLAARIDPEVDMMKLSLPYLLRFLAERD